MSALKAPVRLGRIGYVNVLPIYHPLENGAVPGSFLVTSGPPSRLNDLMAKGLLDVSATSSLEYGQRPGRYLLLPDLAIGSRGPVQSVLLLARRPVEELAGRPILVSSQTHTSAALLGLLLRRKFKVDASFETGDVTARMDSDDVPEACLAIGDEALRLRGHPALPFVYDLGQLWLEWTGLPFIFGVWVVQREAARQPGALAACRALLAAKAWSAARPELMAELAAAHTGHSVAAMADYFRGLVYDLGPEEQAGLRLFFRWLAEDGVIPAAPELEFVDLTEAGAEKAAG